MSSVRRLRVKSGHTVKEVQQHDQASRRNSFFCLDIFGHKITKYLFCSKSRANAIFGSSILLHSTTGIVSHCSPTMKFHLPSNNQTHFKGNVQALSRHIHNRNAIWVHGNETPSNRVTLPKRDCQSHVNVPLETSSISSPSARFALIWEPPCSQ